MTAGKGFTVVELLVMVAVVFILVVLLTPRNKMSNAPRIHCMSNLRQVGLALITWEYDHNDLYPMRALTNAAGGLLFADETNGFRYFQVMSNELATPKVLVCPADARNYATNFATDFNGAHLSYFIALAADERWPAAFLAGDWNITNGQKPVKGILEVRTNQNIGWTKEIHHDVGNVGLVDGSVQQLTTGGLNMALKNCGVATNRLLLPP